MILNLYKNGKLVLTAEGTLQGDEAVFGNIVYHMVDNTLIRQDASYKYLLDFKNEEAEVELKEYNQSLPLTIKVLSIEVSEKGHKISYNIESEQTIENVLEVFF